jgi:hypothetical protein
MAIYRPASRRPMLIAAAIALVAGVVLGVLIGRASAPGTAAAIDGLREHVASVSSLLEVVRTEYPKALEAPGAGAAADPGGAQHAAQQAIDELDAAWPDLALIDSPSTNAARQALYDLDSLILARAPIDDIEAAVERVLAALDQVLPLRGA